MFWSVARLSAVTLALHGISGHTTVKLLIDELGNFDRADGVPGEQIRAASVVPAKDHLSGAVAPRPCALHVGCRAAAVQEDDDYRVTYIVTKHGGDALHNSWHRWHFDVFKDDNPQLPRDQWLFSAAPMEEWTVLIVTVLVALLVDYLVLQRFNGTFWGNIFVLAFWVSAGFAYNVYFFLRYGKHDGLDWCTGFFLEWMLSIDNLFVFHLIFKVYDTPEVLMHKALYFGILGAAVFRMFVFFALGTLVHVIRWVRCVFGIILIYSGIQAVIEAEDDGSTHDVADTYAVGMLRWLLGSRLEDSYDLQGRLFVRDRNGRLCMTLIAYIILLLEFTDIVFAVDSVSAKVAQISNQFIAYSSSVMAIFGLRAMFFVVKDLVDYFELLKYGICMILVFVGVELIASPYVHLESATVCMVILSVFTVSISASTASKLLGSRRAHGVSFGVAPRGGEVS